MKISSRSDQRLGWKLFLCSPPPEERDRPIGYTSLRSAMSNLRDSGTREWSRRLHRMTPSTQVIAEQRGQYEYGRARESVPSVVITSVQEEVGVQELPPKSFVDSA